MKPNDLLDPSQLPLDLQWIASHQKLHPDDPVYLLLGWHAQRTKQAEDRIAALLTEMKAAVDLRITAMTTAVTTISEISAALDAVKTELAGRPEILAKELESQLTKPVNTAVSALQALDHSLKPVAQAFRTAQRRTILATLLSGITLGVVAAFILFVK